MHIGNLRTAFYAYALAKHEEGDFILRIEDTDKKREKEGGVQDIQRLLKIFNINWDEFYIQSERLSLYKEVAEKMVRDGNAFYCQCEAKNAKDDGFSTSLRDECRDKGLTSGAIKLRVPENEEIKFNDFILKSEVLWHSPIVFDATLLKSDGFPTYHLAVVVDDHDMKITHVLRGHDWMPSTPIHLLVYKYLGYEVPEIGHLTDIMDPDGGKLSKRKGSTSVQGLLDEGYLPEALFNFVILAGWAPKDNKELFTLEEFVKDFDQSGFQKSNPVFNREKLDWFNGQYIRKLSVESLLEKLELENNQKNKLIVALIQDRLEKLSDFKVLTKFFYEQPEVDTSLFGENYKEHLKSAIEVFEKIDDWTIEKIGTFSLELCERKEFPRGNFFMTLRIAITGMKFTPPINESIVILGKDETIERLNKLI